MSWLPTEGRIEAVTGELGGGKTAFGVEQAYDLLCTGGYCFSNVEVYPDKIAERMAGERLVYQPERFVSLKGANMKDFHTQLKRGVEGAPVMALVDEADLDLSDRNYRETSEEFINFIKMVRKLDIWLVFIAQDANDMDKKVRRKFTIETNCRNMKHEEFLGMPFPIPLYCRVRWKVYQGRCHHRIGSAQWMLKQKAWGLYNSKALLGEKAQVFEKLGQVRATRLERIVTKNPYGLAAGAAAFVSSLLCAM